jgi:hypothetical protein
MMASKVMLEATQSVVHGNGVAVHSGELFEVGDVPDGVTVIPVLVDVPDKPKPADVKPEPAKPAPKAPAK